MIIHWKYVQFLDKAQITINIKQATQKVPRIYYLLITYTNAYTDTPTWFVIIVNLVNMYSTTQSKKAKLYAITCVQSVNKHFYTVRCFLYSSGKHRVVVWQSFRLTECDVAAAVLIPLRTWSLHFKVAFDSSLLHSAFDFHKERGAARVTSVLPSYMYVASLSLKLCDSNQPLYCAELRLSICKESRWILTTLQDSFRQHICGNIS